MDYVPQLLLDLVYGAALGLTGIGGSILAVPTLVHLVGQDVHTAIGTSLAVVGGIAAWSLYTASTRRARTRITFHPYCGS